jgi:cytochrome bd-type quinol oxidase subunit 2
MRPPSIRLFEKLYLLTIALGLVALALSWNSMTGLAQARAGQDAANGVLIAAAVLGVLIPLLLLYFIARRGSNVAKWIFVVLTAFSVLSFIAGIANPDLPKDALFILNVVSLGLTLYCAWLLFRPDARAWLEHRGDDTGPEDVVG